MADRHELFRNLPAIGVELVGDFVADAVEDHARMVAIAAQHGAKIGRVPLIEVKVIAVFRFAARVFGVVVRPVARPLVECLVEDIEAELIA